MCYQEIKKQTETGDTGQKINIYILKKTKRFFSNLFCTVTSQILLKSTTQKTFLYLIYIIFRLRQTFTLDFPLFISIIKPVKLLSIRVNTSCTE